jgi:SAM-dependent methyltransferase
MSISGEDDGKTASAADPIQPFYNAHPYPPPIDDLSPRLAHYRDPHRRRAQSLLLWPLEKERRNRRILVAGCGTSQAARHAISEPDAEVTAIDISDTSLRFTRALKEKHSLSNLTLHRLEIERVEELGQTFDQIVCTGVLHHLADPDAGLDALRNVLAPDGAMHIMVYAPYGRAGVFMMQAYCRLLDIRPDEVDLRDLAATLGTLGPDHPISRLVKRVKDFAEPDALADALLNPRDRAFTVPEIYDWLDRCGLVFGRWHEQAPYLPQCGAPARAPHATRMVSLDDRAQHAAMELLRGTMDRHAFVAYRNDRARESQPITFEGEAWRGYVPVGLPWSRCVRDRAPPGFSAVLINPAHPYPDLALPIERGEERILAAIDGERSIGEILSSAPGSPAETAGRQFFRRLWEYDHIVFDAAH